MNTYPKNRKRMKEEVITAAKEWLQANSHTPWALMRLELMEDYNPAKLEQLIESGQLMQSIQEWSEELTERHMELMRTGDYNSPQEIGDTMRAELIAEATEPEWSVEELLDRALTHNEQLTDDQKDFLRENLPPWLAAEVDLLP